MDRSVSRAFRVFFLATGLVVISGILIIAFRVSGPQSKLKGDSLPLALQSLDKRMQQKIHAMNRMLLTQYGLKDPLFITSSIRFEGQVFQTTVSPEWNALPRHTKKLILKTVLENYRSSRQQRLKQPGEPTIIFLEDNKKVAVHTILEDIIH